MPDLSNVMPNSVVVPFCRGMITSPIRYSFTFGVLFALDVSAQAFTAGNGEGHTPMDAITRITAFTA